MTDRRPLDDPYIRVRVVGDPGGDPPAWVRAAWLGVEFDARHVQGHVRLGSLSRRRWYPRRARDPWLVVAAEAIAALRAAGQGKAAEWWEQRGFADGFELFVFAGDSCEAVGDPIV